MGKEKYPKHFLHAHSPEEIRNRLKKRKAHSYLRDFVYGGVDGTVTTFAVVSGVIGAEQRTETILILGFANLFADGFSMAASNYLGTKTEAAEHQLAEAYELEQISKNPEGETEEVKQILADKGLSGEILENATQLFVQDRKRWVDLMLKEEYGLASEIRSPLKAGLSTFLAFLTFGLIPLLPFLMGARDSFLSASIMTGVAFFLIGSLKSRWTGEIFWLAGIKTFFVGSIAALLAYEIGFLLKGF